MDQDKLKIVKENFLLKEKYLSEYACKSEDAIRIIEEDDSKDIRPSFYHDIDRIIHSLSYTRYLDKTQVFSYSGNDHISKRIVHVQLVSKIARTIGRALNLNEDLIEAIALGHDIGHTPLGHAGEKILDTISRRELGGIFSHNIHSVRTYMDLENNNKGINLTIQTLDGIMCHNGEMLSSTYKPCLKTKEEFLDEYNKCYTDSEVLRKIRPMTLEGCVVRISDIIGYIGRDIEDAINIGVFNREDIPESIRKTLGTTNREIVNTITEDIINNSLGKDYIKLSDDIFKAIFELKKFNYQNIYDKANTKEQLEYYEKGMNMLFDKYLSDLENNNKDSEIVKVYLDLADSKYLADTNPKRIVIDFIAGMTDEYFISEVKKITNC